MSKGATTEGGYSSTECGCCSTIQSCPIFATNVPAKGARTPIRTQQIPPGCANATQLVTRSFTTSCGQELRVEPSLDRGRSDSEDGDDLPLTWHTLTILKREVKLFRIRRKCKQGNCLESLLRQTGHRQWICRFDFAFAPNREGVHSWIRFPQTPSKRASSSRHRGVLTPRRDLRY